MKKENIKVSDATISNVIRGYKDKISTKVNEPKPKEAPNNIKSITPIAGGCPVPLPPIKYGAAPLPTITSEQQEDQTKKEALLTQRQQELDLRQRQQDQLSTQLAQRETQLQQQITDYDNSVKEKEKQAKRKESFLESRFQDLLARENYVSRYGSTTMYIEDMGFAEEEIVDFFAMVRDRAESSGTSPRTVLVKIIEEFNDEDDVSRRLQKANQDLAAANQNLMFKFLMMSQ